MKPTTKKFLQLYRCDNNIELSFALLAGMPGEDFEDAFAWLKVEVVQHSMQVLDASNDFKQEWDSWVAFTPEWNRQKEKVQKMQEDLIKKTMAILAGYLSLLSKQRKAKLHKIYWDALACAPKWQVSRELRNQANCFILQHK